MQFQSEEDPPSMMTKTGRAILAIGWLVLVLLGCYYSYYHYTAWQILSDHWIIVTAIMIVLAATLVVEWWRWERKIK